MSKDTRMSEEDQELLRGANVAQEAEVAKKAGEKKNHSRVLRLLSAETIVPIERTYTLYPYIPHGELTWVEGSPRCGKTFAMISVIASMSRGESFVNGEPIEQGNIAMLSSEDSIEHTLVPRLLAAKADLSRVSFISAVVGDEEQEIAFFEDLPGIERLLREKNIRLLFVDGVFGFLGVKDTSSYSEAYARMVPLIKMVRRCNIGAPVVRHTRKTRGAALDSGIGSTGYTALGRSTLTVAVSQADKNTRILAHAGVTGAEIGDSYAFQIEGKMLPGFVRSTGYAVWGDKLDITADEALAQDPIESHETRNLAGQFLLATVREAMPGHEVSAKAREEGIPMRTLYRAAKKVGIRIEDRKRAGSIWHPSTLGTEDAPKEHHSDLCAIRANAPCPEKEVAQMAQKSDLSTNMPLETCEGVAQKTKEKELLPILSHAEFRLASGPEMVLNGVASKPERLVADPEEDERYSE